MFCIIESVINFTTLNDIIKKKPKVLEMCFITFSNSLGSRHLDAFKNSSLNIIHQYFMKNAAKIERNSKKQKLDI